MAIEKTYSRRYFTTPKYRLGDIVIIKNCEDKNPTKSLEQGMIVASWVDEDDIGTNSFLENEWEYKIKASGKEVIKKEKMIIFKMYEK